jgi:hypothetical protein
MAETSRLFNDERQQARKSHIAFHTATGQFGLSPCSIHCCGDCELFSLLNTRFCDVSFFGHRLSNVCNLTNVLFLLARERFKLDQKRLFRNE